MAKEAWIYLFIVFIPVVLPSPISATETDPSTFCGFKESKHLVQRNRNFNGYT